MSTPLTQRMEPKFQWNAGDYAAHSSAQEAWAAALMDSLQLRGHETVLDIGCGDGKITAKIAGLLPQGRVVGVDQSPQMLEFAREKHGHKANLSFAAADARVLGFQEEFDVVFSNACLHWVVYHGPVVAGIARALKGGGRFVLSMGGRGNAAAVIRVVDDVCRTDRWRKYFADFKFPYGFHGPEDYRVWARQAGLVVDRAELAPKDMVHESQEKLAGWFRSTWLPYTQCVPVERREALVADLVERCTQAVGTDEGGAIHVPMVRLEVEGYKPAG
ncbi:MAG: methyltransferase domain-containing protein [Phycisphaeraceae bacterium]|nr:methyltransferase domain-containing protein [Phycisphaeraceae bacterium]